MSEEESWRSDSAYDYVDHLTASELAWEFLRRNPDYRTAFQELVTSGRLTDEEARVFAREWGLSFRGKPSDHGARPTDFLDPGDRPCRDRPAGAAFLVRISTDR